MWNDGYLYFKKKNNIYTAFKNLNHMYIWNILYLVFKYYKYNKYNTYYLVNTKYLCKYSDSI